jgi:hypothetical protein
MPSYSVFTSDPKGVDPMTLEHYWL